MRTDCGADLSKLCTGACAGLEGENPAGETVHA